MRSMKMLGLAMVAAMAAMAFVASTASANATTIVLCEKAELTCESPFPEKTTITSHATKPVLLAGKTGNVECNESLSEVELLNKLAALGLGHVKNLTFTGECHLGANKCEVTTLTKGDLSFTKSGALSGNVASVNNAKGEETTVNVKCGFFINCTYGGSPKLTISSTAGGETVLLASKAKLEKSSGFCPEISEWDATYVALGAKWIES